MKLEGKVALITGGANGIGRAISLSLASKGADIIVADLDMEGADNVVSDVKKLGRKAAAKSVDVTKSIDVERMVNEILIEFGKIDILVNNAGGTARVRRSFFHESEEKIWEYVLGINIKGVLNCTRAVINQMIEKRGGKIVSISSVDGIIGGAMKVDYSVAKAGIIGFTMALAKEVAEYGINVNCVSPGPIRTRVWEYSNPSRVEAMKKATGLNRMGEPEDIAAMVLFLVSDDASFITGQNFPVCGLMNLGGGNY